MRSCLVLGVVKMKNIDQVLDLSNCSAPFTDIFISCVSVHEKADESQTGDDRVDAVTLHKVIWKSEIFWEYKQVSAVPSESLLP